MDPKRELVSDFDRAARGLDMLLAGCTEEDAGVRCGADSRTVVAVANHVADWLNVLARLTPDLAHGSVPALSSDVVGEIDAGFAKASAGRTLTETRSRFRNTAAEMRRALQSVHRDDLDLVAAPDGLLIGAFLRRWTCAHIEEHAAAIRAALLTAPGGIQHDPGFGLGEALEQRRINQSRGGRHV